MAIAMMMVPEQLPSILPNIVGWFRMSDTNTMTAVGGATSVVPNKMNTGNNLRQATSTNQPINNNTAQNGRFVLKFDGVNDWMQFDQNTLVSEPFTVFVVSKYNSTTTEQATLGRQTSNIAGQMVIRKESGGSIFNSFLYGTSSGTSSSANFVGNLNANVHCVYFQDGGGINYAINNASFTTGPTRSGYNNAVATGLTAGVASPSSTDYLDGWIGEIIFCNGILNATQIAGTVAYLGNYWGITVA